MSAERLRINERLAIPLAEIEIRASRSSGPGGQHANVTESRIEVSFDIEASQSLSAHDRERLISRFGSVARAVAQDARSQSRNRELALQRLVERIADALRVRKARRPTKPSRSAKRKRIEGKRRRSAVKRARRPPAADD